jgi:hypothetical protein
MNMEGNIKLNLNDDLELDENFEQVKAWKDKIKTSLLLEDEIIWAEINKLKTNNITQENIEN